MRGKWKPTISVTHLMLGVGAVTCAYVSSAHKHKPTRQRNGQSPPEPLCWGEGFLYRKKKMGKKNKSMKGDGDLAL